MSTLFYFIVTIGVLVSFHEFGHFWVARKAGVKVLRFSIGFGKVLWSYQKRPDDTEYVISAIPLGGYVKMVDEREGEVSREDLPFAFNRQSIGARAAIVAAGPLLNLGLAVLLFWVVLVIGETGLKPILGKVEPDTLAAAAGFHEGEEIVTVNGRPTPTWNEALSELVSSALDGDRKIDIIVKDFGNGQNDRVLTIPESDTVDPDALFERLGFQPWMPKLRPVIGGILPDGAAKATGLQKNDLIVSADGVAINDWMQWVDYVKARPNTEIKLVIERGGTTVPLSITPRPVADHPEKKGEAAKTVGKIGAAVFVPEEVRKSLTAEFSLSPWAAIPAAFEKTVSYSYSTLRMMAKMLVGQASVKNLSGPISIAQYAEQSASIGLIHYLKFIALVSVSLGVLNLLPIPVLDGGHLLFYGIEAVKGSPVSEEKQLFFQQIGIALLVSLMALAMVMDIQRLFH